MALVGETSSPETGALTARPAAVVAVTPKMLATTLPKLVALTALSLTEMPDALPVAPTAAVATETVPAVVVVTGVVSIN